MFSKNVLINGAKNLNEANVFPSPAFQIKENCCELTGERICCTSAKFPVAIAEGPYLIKVSFVQSKTLVEDGLAKECVYSDTSHGSLDTARACPEARLLPGKVFWLRGGLLYTLQKCTNIYSVELTRHNDMGVSAGQRGGIA